MKGGEHVDWIKAINDAITYIEDHLTDEIVLNDIASWVNISPFHFQRAFSVIVGMTPAEYLRNRRLSLAGADLARGECQVIDAALKYGYDSPESFARTFTRFHGFTPAQVKNGSPIRFMNRYAVRIVIEGGSIMEYRIEKWDAFDLALHIDAFDAGTDETAIPAIWQAYYEDPDHRKLRGSIGVCASLDKDDRRIYGIGCMADEVEGVPNGFQLVHVPAYTWVIFKCVGPAAESFKEMWHRIYKEWLPASEYEFLTDGYLERILPGESTAPDYVGEICFPVKSRS